MSSISNLTENMLFFLVYYCGDGEDKLHVCCELFATMEDAEYFLKEILDDDIAKGCAIRYIQLSYPLERNDD